MTEKEETLWIYAPCPECNYNNDLNNVPPEGQIVYITCDNCGLIYRTKMPTRENLK